jgi:hypothetical protein
MSKNKILVASHERSGTHFLINAIAANFGYDTAQIDLDLSTGFSLKDPEAAHASLAQYRGRRLPRIFKSHHGYPLLRHLAQDLLEEFHLFYIVRDGRDVMTSFWRYLNSLAPGWGPRSESVGDFMRATPAGGIMQYQHRRSPTMLQRWIDNTASWSATDLPVAIITYEGLHRDFNAVMARIAGILGKPPVIVARPDLEAPSSLPWKGIVGNWRTYFTDEDIVYFESHREITRLYTVD